jgi:carbon-monoxide dehydrogenase medium subunit
VKPAPFEYYAPRSLDEVLERLGQSGGEAKLLAGGQSLVPMMNMRLARPAILIDLGRISGLDYVNESDGHVAIGALTRQRAAERSATVQRHAPLVAKALPWIGHPTIRNRGTIGGSLAHADPAAELPAVATALDAELVVAGPQGRRTAKPDTFFVSYLTTSLAHDEVLVELRLPRPGPMSRVAFTEFSRRHGDFAIAGVAAALEVDDGQTCRSVRLALFGVGPGPVRARMAERVLTGQALADKVVTEAAETAAKEIDPHSDLHASAHYRRRLAAVLVEDALRQVTTQGTKEGR